MQDLVAFPGLSAAWQGDASKTSNEILQRAYTNAQGLLKQTLTASDYDKIFPKTSTDIKDVQEALSIAKRKYEDRKEKQCRARKWLSAFSSRLMYYGKVFDVLAQHHPEYVSLAWGAIKFLFMAVLNHEESILELSKAYARIADALPRARLKLELYSTETMLEAVAQLYSQIMRFSQRAIKWYTGGKLKHMYQSVLQPYSLTYKDIIDEVEACSSRIRDLAADGAQAEQREIHIRMRNIERLITGHHKTIVSSGLLNTPFQLRNIELSQILAFVDKTPLPSPDITLKYHLAVAKRRLRDNPRYLDVQNGFKQLQAWASLQTSSLIMIKGTFQDRAKSRDLAASITSVLKKNKCPIVWALTPRFGPDSKQLSSLDILKNLVLQILQVNKSLLEDYSHPLSAIKFQAARTETEWFELLVMVLIGIPEIYMIIDVEAFRSDLENGRAWPAAFLKLFKDVAERSPKTAIKVAIVSYHTQMDLSAVSEKEENVMRLNVKTKEGREKFGRTRDLGSGFGIGSRPKGRSGR